MVEFYGPYPIPVLLLVAGVGALLAMPAIRLFHPDPAKAKAPVWAGPSICIGLIPLCFAWGGLVALEALVQPAAWGFTCGATAIWLGAGLMVVVKRLPV